MTGRGQKPLDRGPFPRDLAVWRQDDATGEARPWVFVEPVHQEFEVVFGREAADTHSLRPQERRGRPQESADDLPATGYLAIGLSVQGIAS